MKNIKIQHIILFALILPLITQMFNTANLYQSGSNLYGWEKLIAAYFVGVSFEFSIFVCILAGSRTAGAWFAILSFFVGILFHDSWDYFIIDFPNVIKDPMHISYHKKFYTTTLLQLINSILVWFLSELYVTKLKETKVNKALADLEQKVADTEQQLAEQIQKSAGLNRILADTDNVLQSRRNDIVESNQRLTEIELEIKSLQKKKAGMSRGITT